ncbi:MULTISPECIES: glycosyl transferase [Acetobacter]|uniref:Glycosyl transferase n=1 Tax=Acetobacter pomorum TaxID=65959 RepID=A0AAN1PJL0_9PROT|nr:glycosyl transferase [Acetobacter pomorum]KAA8394946.1 glycosyl transferase [Acetobacter sp. DmW_125124]KAA8397760.1 glycosyl transferase [Acetobacter sp. DmW_125127]KAA8401163.1 glycosyl transferase [Acetobacter sp. DmW_125128]KAA8404857.1 glycosyl transferase [Acetobacter sp. DmW_125132]KAA8405527.1 glycosyl transferase [Acetobacter sp. DmW_125133]KAA8408966.1 glycosyl transferase [Acetobacter sp. DmW_125134]KAA8411224.1 glycosyl transferase [Acetobacter sp. DmW_125135]KAA8411836.1 gly
MKDLRMNAVVKLFIGCDPNDCDLEQLMVLHYSITKYSSLPVDITFMQLTRDPSSFWYSGFKPEEGWNTTEWPTPFSGFRWGIPAYCGGKGRALYMDADIFALSDIAKLWNLPIPEGKVMLASGQGRDLRLGTLMWDCEAAMKLLPPLAEIKKDASAHKKLKTFFEKHPKYIQPLDPAFSNLDGDGMPLEALKFLHYSDMGTQFSHKYSLQRLNGEDRKHWFDGTIYNHPRPDLQQKFDELYKEALEAGFSLDTYRVKEHFGVLPKKTQVRYKGNKITRSLFRFLKPIK